jgi:hypothetical protein
MVVACRPQASSAHVARVQGAYAGARTSIFLDATARADVVLPSGRPCDGSVQPAGQHSASTRAQLILCAIVASGSA